MKKVKNNLRRLVSIDRFRGFIVFCMCFFITAAEFPSLGFLSRIANNSSTSRLMVMNGISIGDLINPTFVFLISLSYQSSFDRRYEKNKKKAYLHFILRYLLFLGLGSIMVSAEDFVTRNDSDPYYFMTILMFSGIIMIVVNIALSFIKRLSTNIKKICRNVLYVILIILGLTVIILGIRDDIIIFLLNNENIELYKHWSILCEIGMTGLITLPFMKLKRKDKIFSWFAILIVYTLFQKVPGIVDKFDIVVLGGLLGTIGWLIIMLGGIIMMDIYKKENKIYYITSCIILILISILLFKVLPINKSAITSNFTVFALTYASIAFLLVNLFNTKKPKYDYFSWFGKNPLPIYGIFLLIRLTEKMWDTSNVGFFVGFIFTFGTTALLSYIAYYLDKKKIIIKL